MCPGILTITCTKYLRRIAITVLLYWRRDIDLTVECATEVVVTAIDGTRLQVTIIIQIGSHSVTFCDGIIAAVVHHRLIGITRHIVTDTIATTEDALEMDGRACRHIHHRTTGDTLLIAGSENIFDTTMNQVDDGRCLVRLTLHRLTVFLMIHQYGRRHSHT